MRAQILNSLNGFQQCKPLYEKILSQMESGSDNVFLLYQWHDIYLETYKNSAKPLVIIISDGNVPVALFPLCIRKRSKWGIPYEYLEYAGADTCTYSDFLIVKDANIEEVFKTFLQTLLGIWRLKWLYFSLPMLATSSPKTSSFLDALKSFSLSNEIINTVVPYIRIEGDWEWYCREYISKNLSHDLHRQTNRTKSEIGEATLQNAGIEDLEQFHDMHIKEWASRGERSRYFEPENREFDKDLLEKFEHMDFTKLKFGEKTVAHHLGYKYKGKFYLTRSAFNVQYSRFSPGKLILATIIKREIELKDQMIDLGRGDQEYKHWFAKEELPLTGLSIYRSRAIYKTMKLAQKLRRGLRRWS